MEPLLMADFVQAYYITNQIEGGYANDKDDLGGETYRGVSRVNWPKWSGWEIIDSLKKSKSFPENLDKNVGLQNSVQHFYESNFWNMIQGSLINNQAIANEVYDNAVHMGVERSAEYLQRTINILNRNGKLYKDIPVDRKIGNGTINALHTCIKANGAKRVLNVINGFQVKHYLEAMEKRATNEKYIGWFDRVEIIWG